MNKVLSLFAAGNKVEPTTNPGTTGVNTTGSGSEDLVGSVTGILNAIIGLVLFLFVLGLGALFVWFV